jgi:phage baseplate assembly protein W
MENQTESFTGTGWRFPVRINNRGGLSYSRTEDEIEEAIWIILGTARGERTMLPEFGCGIHDLVFAPLSPSMIGNIEYHVNEALLQWEPRIDVVDVRVEQQEQNKLLIMVDYKVRSSNVFYNIVYPFYFTEGDGS